MTMTKTFAAMTVGGFVLFTFDAKNSTEARETVKSLRKRSDTITGVRLLKANDISVYKTFEHR